MQEKLKSKSLDTSKTFDETKHIKLVPRFQANEVGQLEMNTRALDIDFAKYRGLEGWEFTFS